jgi:hypothetical protein
MQADFALVNGIGLSVWSQLLARSACFQGCEWRDAEKHGCHCSADGQEAHREFKRMPAPVRDQRIVMAQLKQEQRLDEEAC